ncbi:hypothetical protein JGU66_32180 [Myxococcaceae bacterium JPH2]|nr:hypothetical protein [Myxococcaceae bacterium JPH2]
MSKWLLATLTLSLPVLAQAGGPPERAQDRRELREDRREQRDDRRDLHQLESLINRYDAARGRRDRNDLNRVESELRAYIASELDESHHELAKDVREVRRDNRELRDDRNGWSSPGARADDRRDRRDDVRDARAERASLEQTRSIARELDGLYGRTDPGSLQRKRALMGDLLQLARAEQMQNHAEMREDRRELREDGAHRH